MASDIDPARSPISKRIERRLQILAEWERDGIPPNLTFPRSLAEAREWSLPAFGVQPIGSPSDFTTTHREHGRKVMAIWSSIKRLKLKYERPRLKPSLRDPVKSEAWLRIEDLRAELSELKSQLVHVVSQWSSARDSTEREKTRADNAEREAIRTRTLLLDRDREIAELRRQLRSRRELRVIE